MAIKLTTTSKTAGYLKMLAYGFAGVGKTVLCSTAPNPIIISAEGGLLSLADHDIPVVEIHNIDDLTDAFVFVTESKEGKVFETICLDSITDIAEVMLSDLKKNTKDPRAAYGDLGDKMGEAIRAFRDLPGRHVYMTAKAKRITNDVGVTSFIPSMPGQILTTNLPYWFDMVMPLRIGETLNDQNEMINYRYLQTVPDLYWEAKDRSGKCDPMEEPNLAKIIAKITKTEKTTKKKEK
jgi:hypothetical protein